ncbi:hypothetical protein GCM10027447_12850 [Glycomyces halotolerans]
MSDLERFDFEGLDESAFGLHPEHGPLVHKAKFMKWIGYDTANASRTADRHLQPGDLVKGVFSPIGLKNQRGRKADALTKRGVQRLLFRSDHPKAIQYTDRVLDMLDQLDRTGMVVDEQRITDDQIEAGKERLDALQRQRLAERMDYGHVKHALAQGGAISEDYRVVQNTLYIELFGMTAAAIRAVQPQLTGERRKDGEFTAASKTVAKNYLTEAQLSLLNNTVLAMFVQISQHYPNGASVRQMLDAVHRAVALTKPRAVAA